jgi:hypothetical protein
MVNKYSFWGTVLVLGFAATACNIGTPVPPTAQPFGLPSVTPGGTTQEPQTPIRTASDWAVHTPSEAGTPAPSRTYAVVLIPEGGTLDAHAAAGDGSPLTGTLTWDAVDLHSTGNVETIGAEVWVEVEMPGGGTGWVNRKNLTEYVPAGTFCADSRATTLFAGLSEALRTSDGRLLTPIVSPVHGLTVTYIHNGNPRGYSPSDAGMVFGSGEVVDWGLGPGSGLPVQGTFADLVRPDLLAVFGASYETHCSILTLGGASYTVTWPSLWKNINFYSVYKPGSPGIELDWMTWLTGMEYVDGNPYLFSLSRYNWEP